MNNNNNSHQTKRYKWSYDVVLSKLYDFGLKIGLTPIGEQILRISVFNAIFPYVKKGDLILDLCCGTGTLTILLRKLLYSDCEIIGVDLSSGQIEQARKKHKSLNIKFEVMDANRLEFNNKTFDIVIISAALHEMETNQRLNVLKEIYRVLKKSGHFLIFDHHEPSKVGIRILYNFYLGFWEKLLSHSFDMQRTILRELQKTGFIILKQTSIKEFYNFFQTILSKKKNR